MASLPRRPVMLIALAGVIALFIWGIVTLVSVRFEQGESFSPYSSFRADPLGSRGIYGSLDRVESIDTRRHLRPLAKLDGAPGQTVMVLGVPANVLEDGDSSFEKEVLRLAEEGSRVLIAAKPASESFLQFLQKKQAEKEAEAGAEDEETAEEGSPEAQAPVPEDQELPGDAEAATADEEPRPDWGLDFAWESVDEDLAPDYLAGRNLTLKGLPEFLQIHTPLTISSEDGSWRSVYSYGPRMVVAEREWGEGSLVVFVDAFPFSNESLRRDSEAELILWAIGGARDVVFAEAHLGVHESPGLMTLIQRYRMDGILLALFMVAVLVVWKNAIPLVPPPPAAEGGAATRDHFSGLVNLLQRHIRLADLPEACLREWQRSLPRYGFPGEEKRKQIRQQTKAEIKRPEKERRPLNLYNKICKILTERNI